MRWERHKCCLVSFLSSGKVRKGVLEKSENNTYALLSGMILQLLSKRIAIPVDSDRKTLPLAFMRALAPFSSLNLWNFRTRPILTCVPLGRRVFVVLKNPPSAQMFSVITYIIFFCGFWCPATTSIVAGTLRSNLSSFLWSFMGKKISSEIAGSEISRLVTQTALKPLSDNVLFNNYNRSIRNRLNVLFLGLYLGENRYEGSIRKNLVI